MDRCAEASHDSCQIVHPVYISPYSHQERTLTTNLPSSVWCINTSSLPPYPNPLPPKACEKSFKLHSAQALSTSVQNIIK